MNKIIFPILTALLFLGCGSPDKNQEIVLYAAAGTRMVMETLCDSFEKKHECTIHRNYASSGTLARQIEQGAACQVFVSANKQWVTHLQKQHLLIDTSIQVITTNQLAIIGKPGFKPTISDDQLPDTLINYSCVIGDPGYVPVGKYAVEALKKLQWWQELQPRLVFAKDVSAALHYVSIGECDWGIVYKTEALLSDKVNILSMVPDTLHSPIDFYCAILKNTDHNSQLFLNFLLSKEAKTIFEHYGFRF